MVRLTFGVMAAVATVTLVVTSATSTSTQWTPSTHDRFQIILSATPTPSQLQGSFSVMEIDGFEATGNEVSTLHSLKKHAVCYIDVGTWENWRPDAGSFPKSVLGASDAGWPGERWLDIRRQDILLPIMRKRFAMCVTKGFDAVDPDNINGIDNRTGFKLTRKEQLSYDRAVAAVAHSDHLAVALKSFAGGAKSLQPNFDFVVDEQCVSYQECAAFATFVAGEKPVFDIEYSKSLLFCAALPTGVFGIAKHLSLDAWIRQCP